jgi:putative DNA primase/helicase
MAATVSRGGYWPDDYTATRGSVVIWSGEDDPKDTLIPRLIACEADLERIFFVEDVLEDGKPRAFNPARDIEGLRAAIQKAGNVVLLIVDPIVSAVSGDSRKNSETRAALQPLVNLAAEIGAALVGVTHFSKGSNGREPIERITGSIAFAALPRIIMIAAKEPSNEEGTECRRILARAKSNIGPDEGGFAYRLKQVPMPGDDRITASIAEWGEMIEGSARDMLAVAEAADDEDGGTAFREAEEFLADVLAPGPVLAKEVQRQAKEAGVSDRTLKRAKAKLKVRSRRSAEPGASAHWTWERPQGGNSAKDAKKTGVERVGTLAGTLPEMDDEPL